MSAAHAARLPPALASAVDRLGQAAASICEQCRQSLALSALALPPGLRRDHAQEGHLLLSRAAGSFQAEFTRALAERLQRQWIPEGVVVGDGASSWDSWSLVDDHEIDLQVAAERFGRSIGQGCEWELRELDGYLRELKGPSGTATGRPPAGLLQPDSIGHAVLRALEALPASADVRKVVAAEMATTWAAHLARIYTQIIGEMRAAGITPSSIGVRAGIRASAAGGRPAGEPPSVSPRAARPPGGPPTVDAGLTVLLREWIHASDATAGDRAAAVADSRAGAPGTVAAVAPANVIAAHRDELLRTLSGPLDRLVIDVVAALFEQILADPDVPAVIAQQIGRLQLPVLRTALADPAFFASRRHPVRLLVNRLASLGLALDDLEPAAADALVHHIRDQVRDIVHGDFEQSAAYERALADLEQFVAEMGRREIEHQGATPQLLAEREADLQAQMRTARALRAELHPLPVPGFLRDFVADVWTRVLVVRAQSGGLDGQAVAQARQVARDLLLSVQPKNSPEQRKDFVARLPRLMEQLSGGLDEIGWPQAARHDFFGQLLPAHAQSLRGDAMRSLDVHELARQVDQALDGALQRARRPGTPSASAAVPLDTTPEPLLSSVEASAVGLLAEDQVDWSAAPGDPDPGAGGPLAIDELAIAGLPHPEAPEPTQGRALADHVRLGVVYRMHLDGEWHAVRLTHVSPARTFYVFARGRRHQRVVSLTHRMLVRMCESGRLRALETAYLLERATARARQQLERLNATTPERG